MKMSKRKSRRKIKRPERGNVVSIMNKVFDAF
jgi:hypothetical protein